MSSRWPTYESGDVVHPSGHTVITDADAVERIRAAHEQAWPATEFFVQQTDRGTYRTTWAQGPTTTEVLFNASRALSGTCDKWGRDRPTSADRRPTLLGLTAGILDAWRNGRIRGTPVITIMTLDYPRGRADEYNDADIAPADIALIKTVWQFAGVREETYAECWIPANPMRLEQTLCAAFLTTGEALTAALAPTG
jgi:hypothetical protein